MLLIVHGGRDKPAPRKGLRAVSFPLSSLFGFSSPMSENALAIGRFLLYSLGSQNL